MDLKNGKIMEQLVAGAYLNSTRRDRGKVLAEEMGKQGDDVKTAFTYLNLAWLGRLSKTECYDVRSEALVQLAKEIYDRPVELPQIAIFKEVSGQETDRCVNMKSPRDVAEALATYLRADSKERYAGFLQALMEDHRILQQNFTRMGMCWLQEDCRDRKELSWICEIHVHLPFI
ncbi:hypothetical protein H6B07_04085 [Mediterraneibacter glycyrrhizinilyticus]|nr:hypothetical protein [Mediterraneibacter glycyrrhizinilyticus]MBM6801858.1 hypothetical protein [Mediterraneibacter glycyrrhizinilyticus]